jgi:hypothetical protein
VSEVFERKSGGDPQLRLAVRRGDAGRRGAAERRALYDSCATRRRTTARSSGRLYGEPFLTLETMRVDDVTTLAVSSF